MIIYVSFGHPLFKDVSRGNLLQSVILKNEKNREVDCKRHHV